MNYYNEFDPKTAAWLRELIKMGAIPNGDVDERSIVDVQPSDLRDYTQCHFFAGIGGWSYALQLAGWPKDRPVWTGSCPCQPFSTAGKGRAQSDERHLWPTFFNLIRECRPERVFGEQVASAIGHGWLDGVSADLESENYSCGSAVLGAHSVGSPHIRQRLYWVADATSKGLEGAARKELQGFGGRPAGGCEVGWMDNSRCERDEFKRKFGVLGCSSDKKQGEAQKREWGRNADSDPVQNHPWSHFRPVHCRDGKTRRVPTEPAFFPLAHGIPARVVRLRGYGNAIVPQCAQAFIEVFLDIQNENMHKMQTGKTSA